MFHVKLATPSRAVTVASVGGPLLVLLTTAVSNPVRRSGRMASSGK